MNTPNAQSLQVARELTWQDWEDRVARALQTGHFTADDKEKTMSWTSCPVGVKYELYKFSFVDHVERSVMKQMLGWDIYHLGSVFVDSVGMDSPTLASHFLSKIARLPSKLPQPELDEAIEQDPF